MFDFLNNIFFTFIAIFMSRSSRCSSPLLVLISLKISKILLLTLSRSKSSLSRTDILLLLLFFSSLSLLHSCSFFSYFFYKIENLSSFSFIILSSSLVSFFSVFTTVSNSSSLSCKFWISRILFSSALLKISSKSSGWNLIISCYWSSSFSKFSVRYNGSSIDFLE